MAEHIMLFEKDKRYSDLREQYFMYPNFLYDEGEFLNLSIHASYGFGYMIRKANKQNKENGKKDIIYFSAEELARKCGFSVSTAKKVIKELIEQEWIRKITTGSNLTGKANTYRILFPYPQYKEQHNKNICRKKYIRRLALMELMHYKIINIC